MFSPSLRSSLVAPSVILFRRDIRGTSWKRSIIQTKNHVICFTIYEALKFRERLTIAMRSRPISCLLPIPVFFHEQDHRSAFRPFCARSTNRWFDRNHDDISRYLSSAGRAKSSEWVTQIRLALERNAKLAHTPTARYNRVDSRWVSGTRLKLSAPLIE
jgi:hypothetical protein